jgi:hypothetical protein
MLEFDPTTARAALLVLAGKVLQTLGEYLAGTQCLLQPTT